MRQQLLDSMPEYAQHIQMDASSSERTEALKKAAAQINNDFSPKDLPVLSKACKDRSMQLMALIDANSDYDYQDFRALVCDVVNFCANATNAHFGGGLEENLFDQHVKNSLVDPRMINDFDSRPVGALVAAELALVLGESYTDSIGLAFLKSKVTNVMSIVLENSRVISAHERDEGYTLEHEYEAKKASQQQAREFAGAQSLQPS